MPRVSGTATAASFRRPGGNGARRITPPPAAGPPKSVISGSAGNSNSSSLTINAPANIALGNLLVMVGGWDSRSLTAPILPSGWSQVGANFEGDFATVFVATKTATGSEPASYTVTCPAGFSAGLILQLAHTTGLDGNPSYGHAASSSSAVANSVTAAHADIWVVGYVDCSNGDSFGTPAGLTVGPSSQSAGNQSSYGFYKSVNAGATGTATSAASGSTNWVSVSLLC